MYPYELFVLINIQDLDCSILEFVFMNMTTSLWKGKLLIQTSSIPLKNWSCIISCLLTFLAQLVEGWAKKWRCA